MRKRLLALLAITLPTLFAGCGGETAAVAKLTVSPSALRLPPREVTALKLSWEPKAALDTKAGPPIVFVHLLDDKDTVLRTFDHPFPEAWKPGAPVTYEIKLFQSALAKPLPAGKYRLTVGLYGQEGPRWPLAGAGKKVGKHEYEAAEVTAPPKGKGPRFTFSQQWLPTEPGTDRQVVARRWLVGRGAFRVSGIHEKGTLWLALHIPRPEPGETLVYEEGATQPEATVTNSCGGEAGVSGEGVHDVELPMGPPAEGDSCRLTVKANFHLELRQARRAVSLEALAWIPSSRGKE